MTIKLEMLADMITFPAHYAGPDRVQNVTIRGSRAQSANMDDKIRITQNITWDAPPNHHNIQHYVIKYQMQGQTTGSVTNRTSSNATQATLELLVPQGQTSTYTVWVAAVNEAGQGEFSNRVDFNYSSKPSRTIYIYPCLYTFEVQLLVPLHLSCPCRTSPTH